MFRRRALVASALGALVLALTAVASAGLAPAATSAAPLQQTNLLRWAYVIAWDPSSYQSLRQNISRLDYVSPFWFSISGDGQITRNDHNDEIMRLMRANNVKIVPTVKNNDAGSAFHPMLRTAEARRAAIDRIIALVNRYGYDGIHIDFEDLLPTDRANLTAFQTELWNRLKQTGKLVTMTLNAKTRERFDGFAGAHDYKALSLVNDLILIQAYGHKVAGSFPGGPGAPIDWVEDVLKYSVSEIPREKLLLGIPWYGFTWNMTKGPPGASISFEGAMGLAQRFNGQLGYDEATQTPFLRYTRDGDVFEAWFENQRSLDAKIALARKYGVRGVGGWRMGFEDPASWNTWPRPVPPPSTTYWLRGYPEATADGCTWYIAQWSDSSFSRTPWRCPANVTPTRDGRSMGIQAGYPERGADGCVWYVTRWADSVFTKVPFSCPADTYALRPATAPPPAVAAPATGNTWQRGYPEAGREGCTWYVALWSDGSYTRVPWRCPAGISPQRQDRAVSVQAGYPERGTDSCVWYVARWADGVFTKVPFECPAGAVARKP